MTDDVAVIHHDLSAKGGGEAVCMAVLEALQDRYDVTLLSLTAPDFEALNDYFDTAVDPVPVERPAYLAPAIHDRWGLKFYILQNALLGRYARRRADDFDLLVSTINELGLGAPSVQYVHFPFDWTVNLADRDHVFHPTVEEDGLYEQLCSFVAGVDATDIRSNVLLANSEWTAAAIEEAYGVEPLVVYPPVDTSGFEPRSWEARESGFVAVGRIERSKRIAELVEIVDRVRDRGHDTHIHVVGSVVDDAYYEEVRQLAAGRPHVHLDGELPREELVELICSHRYGIHGKKYEHFGMAVAELAAGGTVPFVPATGGPNVIVGDRDELLYESIDDAVESIDAVLSAPKRGRDLRIGRREIRERFGRERFATEFRRIVTAALDAIDEGDGSLLHVERPATTVAETD